MHNRNMLRRIESMQIRFLALAILGAAIGLVALPALAAADAGDQIDWPTRHGIVRGAGDLSHRS
jgi:hypothetical protein